nr:hypothetical protein [Streptomyces achromogenes]
MEGGDVLEVAGGYQGRRRVADDRQQDLGQRAGVSAGQMRHGEDGYAGQAQREAGGPACAQLFRVAEETGQGDADDGDARDQQARRRAGQVPFRVGEGEPGADDLDDREGQHGLPVRPHGAGQPALAQGEGE